jgi:hypothetical protein
MNINESSARRLGQEFCFHLKIQALIKFYCETRT